MSKGFQNFVKSLITDKKQHQSTNQTKQQQLQTQSQVSNQPVSLPNQDMGDLDLIKMINNEQTQISISNADSRLRGVGLGFEKGMTQTDYQAILQMQKLKKQIQLSKDKDQKQDKKDKTQKSEDDHIKSGISKKKGFEAKRDYMRQKTLEKRLKKQKQKDKKLKSLEQETKQEIEEPQIEIEEEEEEEEKQMKKKSKYREVIGGRMRKRTKTRSRQKNKRKDNRPLEEKRQKLQSKGIQI